MQNPSHVTEVLKNFFRNREQTFGREIIRQFGSIAKTRLQDKPIKVLDVGCGDGDDLISFKNIFSFAELYGIELSAESRERSNQKGIVTDCINLEKDRFPFSDQNFDIIICNQVLEHLKNIFHPLSEMARILKPGGYLIIGVPNLAAWHNRLVLLMGLQPRCIRVISGHVRGFTYNEFKQLFRQMGMFEIVKRSGDAFYGIPFKNLSHLVAVTIPPLAGTLHLLLRRNDLPFDDKIIEKLGVGVDTNY